MGRRACRRAKDRPFKRRSQVERENMQRLEGIDTEGDDDSTVVLEKTCGMRNCIRVNRKMREYW